MRLKTYPPLGFYVLVTNDFCDICMHANATLRDLEDELRSNWQKGTTEDLYRLIEEKSNLDKAEIVGLVEKLFDEGKIAYDPDGWLKWLK